MERLLTDLLTQNTMPVVTAMLLGFLVSISPCPLATNITAIGFIGKDMSSRRRVFLNGLMYTLGTVFSYTILAGIIYFGADKFEVSGIFQRYGMQIIGPLMVIIGLVMSDIIKLPFPSLTRVTHYFENKGTTKLHHAFLLGILLALAFCPNTGALYFGMLIPLTIGSKSGLLIPVIFALSSALPVVVFAYLIAYTLNGVGIFYGKIKIIELWIRRIVSFIFILAGIFLIYKVYF